jgi:hypothetical protein
MGLCGQSAHDIVDDMKVALGLGGEEKGYARIR